ncbi:MAG: type III toxin-antitoxin system ToxN/AbiQ family toxin [Treponema sp.]
MEYKFSIISDKYITYLHKVEPNVMLNKEQVERTYHRKYLGLIQEINGYKYFIPLSSPKQKDYDAKTGKIRSDNLLTIYIRRGQKLYGTLRFNNMIPVPESEIIPYDLNDEGDLKYKMIVLNELYFVRSNQDKIEKKALSLYKAKIHSELQEKDSGKKKLLEITLDFKNLEKYCQLFGK